MSRPRPCPNGKLRILHVLDARDERLARHVAGLAREQAAHGHSVGVFADDAADTDGVGRLGAMGSDLEFGLRRIAMPRGPHPRDLVGIVAVERHARRCAIDVLHGHGAKGGLYARAGALAGFGAGPIRCYTPGGGSLARPAASPLRALVAGAETLLARRTDLFLFDTLHTAQRFHQSIGDTRATVRIVHAGVGPDAFEPIHADADAADFLAIGARRATDGLVALIDAVAILGRRLGRPVSLAIVGADPGRAKLEAQARARGIADHIRFVDALPIRGAFALGRTLVAAGSPNAIPDALLEAAAAQVPMIAPDVGGIGELFGPYRDALIAAGRPALLVAAMERAMEIDRVRLAAQTRDLRDFVAGRFTIETMTSGVLTGYREALARRAGAADALQVPIPLPS